MTCCRTCIGFDVASARVAAHVAAGMCAGRGAAAAAAGPAADAAPARVRRAQAGLARHSSGAEWVAGEAPSSPMGPRMNLHVGVLHYTPFREPFPLLAEPVTYTPDTLDIWVRA